MRKMLAVVNEIDGDEEYFEDENDASNDYEEEDNFDSDDDEFYEDEDLGDENDEEDGSSCPACGGSEYMCCNYWIERNS